MDLERTNKANKEKKLTSVADCINIVRNLLGHSLVCAKNQHASFVNPMRQPRGKPVPFIKLGVEHMHDLGYVFISLRR